MWRIIALFGRFFCIRKGPLLEIFSDTGSKHAFNSFDTSASTFAFKFVIDVGAVGQEFAVFGE